MTAFLIQSGADVDTLEHVHKNDFLVKPLSQIWRRIDAETADEDIKRADGCYKLLLDADSDLTSVELRYRSRGDYWTSAYAEALAIGSFVKLKALIDIGEPFISLEATGVSNPFATIPLHLIADYHSGGWSDNCQTPDKVALLLSRGANVEARNYRGETSLHAVFSRHFILDLLPRGCDKEAALQRHLSESIDILVLLCSAGADVCAIDDKGRSVSNAAFDSGKEVAWTEALKYCGIDINDVLVRPNVDPARSTALSSRYNKRPTSVTSKLSLAEYLKRRKPCARTPPWLNPSRDLSSSEDDDSENEDYNNDDESEREDSAGDTNETSAGREGTSVPKNEKSDSTYKGRGKAKLD